MNICICGIKVEKTLIFFTSRQKDPPKRAYTRYKKYVSNYHLSLARRDLLYSDIYIYNTLYILTKQTEKEREKTRKFGVEKKNKWYKGASE